MKWDEPGRTKAELAYQRGVLGDLKRNRVSLAAERETLNLGPNREPPTRLQPTEGGVSKSSSPVPR